MLFELLALGFKASSAGNLASFTFPAVVATLFLSSTPFSSIWAPPTDSTSDAFLFILVDWSMYCCATVSDLCPAESLNWPYTVFGMYIFTVLC